VITEKRFAASHHAFWHELLPLGEHYVRQCNLGLGRFDQPLRSLVQPKLRGVVNEFGFRLFSAGVSKLVPARALPPEVLSDELANSVAFIERFRQHGRGQLARPGDAGVQEAIAIAERIAGFLASAAGDGAAIVPRPRFFGCGWLSECEGDVFCGDVLYEFKAGVRAFRMVDIRQLLIYCALNYASKTFEIRDVCLMNPRHGIFFSESVEGLCQALAARSSVDVLGEVVEYLSEGSAQYSSA
jgi:hypothetical protein